LNSKKKSEESAKTSFVKMAAFERDEEKLMKGVYVERTRHKEALSAYAKRKQPVKLEVTKVFSDHYRTRRADMRAGGVGDPGGKSHLQEIREHAAMGKSSQNLYDLCRLLLEQCGFARLKVADIAHVHPYRTGLYDVPQWATVKRAGRWLRDGQSVLDIVEIELMQSEAGGVYDDSDRAVKHPQPRWWAHVCERTFAVKVLVDNSAVVPLWRERMATLRPCYSSKLESQRYSACKVMSPHTFVGFGVFAARACGNDTDDGGGDDSLEFVFETFEGEQRLNRWYAQAIERLGSAAALDGDGEVNDGSSSSSGGDEDDDGKAAPSRKSLTRAERRRQFEEERRQCAGSKPDFFNRHKRRADKLKTKQRIRDRQDK
jgi:hypothetical protein